MVLSRTFSFTVPKTSLGLPFSHRKRCPSSARNSTEKKPSMIGKRNVSVGGSLKNVLQKYGVTVIVEHV